MQLYSCMPNNLLLDFWIKNNLNVLFHGRHGVGKTSMIVEAFKRNNIRFQMFSASTMDPWVDFVGVPKEVTDEKGSYLELIRPKAFRDDEVEALVFDEFNRSHKKVRNAVMELIQFKSINGKKFPKLKMIWAAVNPDEDSELKFDVEKLDPAQEDRFHVHIEIPYKPHMSYFREKYGRDKAEAVIDWWNGLPEKGKLEVSPRRLEFALQHFAVGGNLLHILPPASNVDKLEHSLKNGSPIREFKAFLSSKDEDGFRAWLDNENNYNAIREEINKHCDECLHLLPEEKLCSLLSIDNKISNYVLANQSKFIKTIEEIAKNSQNKKLQNQAKRLLEGSLIMNNGNTVFNYTIVPSTVARWANETGNNYRWNLTPLTLFKKKARHHYNLEHSLAACSSRATIAPNQTPERIRILNSVIHILEKSLLPLSIQDARTALGIIDWVANRTQTSSMRNKTENLIPAINKCLKTLHGSSTSYSPKEFAKDYPSIVGKLIAKCSVNDTLNWAIIP